MSTQSMKALVLSLVFLMCENSSAFSPRTPYLHVVSSGGRYVFVMVAGKIENRGDKWVQTEPPNGSVFKATREGKFEKLWSVEGWFGYPDQVFLSSAYKTLVRIREDLLKPDGTFRDYEESDHCLCFYRKGKLIKSYTIKDLVTDLKTGLLDRGDGSGPKWVDFADERAPKIVPYWKAHLDEATGDLHPMVFQLTTLEGQTFIFDLEAGRILTSRPNESRDESDKEHGALTGEEKEQDVDPLAPTNAEQGGAGQPPTRPE